MGNHYVRQEVEGAIELVCELYPKAFFANAGKRHPLKNDIVTDLVKDGVGVAPELLRQAIDWYQSSFGYQMALQAGVKRIDLNGRPVGTVTETEQNVARKYIAERKASVERGRNEQRDIVVERLPSKLPVANSGTAREESMPKTTAKSNALEPIRTLLDATQRVYEQQPDTVRRLFAVAGLRALIAETERIIATMEARRDESPKPPSPLELPPELPPEGIGNDEITRE
jgi:ProP effector